MEPRKDSRLFGVAPSGVGEIDERAGEHKNVGSAELRAGEPPADDGVL